MLYPFVFTQFRTQNRFALLLELLYPAVAGLSSRGMLTRVAGRVIIYFEARKKEPLDVCKPEKRCNAAQGGTS